MARVLLHVDDEPVNVRIDISDYKLESGEPLEVVNDHHAELILQQKHYHGIVEVPVTRTRQGVTYDIESAIGTATEALALADEKVVNDYITTQLDTRLSAGKPAVPPQGRAKKIIERDNIDLGQYGINPVGWVKDKSRPSTRTSTPGVDSPETIQMRKDLALAKMENLHLQGKITDEAWERAQAVHAGTMTVEQSVEAATDTKVAQTDDATQAQAQVPARRRTARSLQTAQGKPFAD